MTFRKSLSLVLGFLCLGPLSEHRLYAKSGADQWSHDYQWTLNRTEIKKAKGSKGGAGVGESQLSMVFAVNMTEKSVKKNKESYDLMVSIRKVEYQNDGGRYQLDQLPEKALKASLMLEDGNVKKVKGLASISKALAKIEKALPKTNSDGRSACKALVKELANDETWHHLLSYVFFNPEGESVEKAVPWYQNNNRQVIYNIQNNSDDKCVANMEPYEEDMEAMLARGKGSFEIHREDRRVTKASGKLQCFLSTGFSGIPTSTKTIIEYQFNGQGLNFGRARN